jgi:uncharacterized protein YegJ (DUF2314 family)
MRKLLLLLGVGIALVSLAASARAEDKAPEPGTVVAAGDVRNRRGFYSLVFYFTPEPRVPAEATARALIGEYFPGLTIVDDAAQTPKTPFIAIETEAAPLKNFPVPDAGYFKHAGRGLSADDIAAIQQTSLAFRLILITPKADIWAQTRRFTELGHAFAVKTGAFLWDSATRECFSPAAWKTRRLDTWTDPIPNLPEQFTIHAYRVAETNYVRAITLGMEKFALPDLVIQQLLASETRSGGNLINVAAQLLAENPEVEKPAAFPVSLPALKNEALRTGQRTNLLKGATEEASLALVVGRLEDGDPDNPLFELDFRNGAGRSNDERRQATFAQIWGSADTLIGVRHNEAILAASKAAKAKLPALQKIFAHGLAPGERIILKAPFARDDGEGNEWMWVEILKWPEQGKVTGILQNEPHYVKKLRAGSRVLIKPEEVFDYVHYKSDGTEEGNETGRLMQQQQNAEAEDR